MSKGKESRPKESPNRDPQPSSFGYDEFFQNKLALTEDIKSYLSEKNLDWRFINANQFRSAGNTHRSHWRPYKFENSSFGVLNAEGYITRGDLILAVREKQVSAAHRKFLNQRNNIQKSFNKTEAKRFQEDFRRQGISEKVTDNTDDMD